VTYIDVLGFRELVKNKSAGDISQIIRRLKEVTLPNKEVGEMYEETHQTFSDLIVHTVPIDSSVNKSARLGLVYLQILKLVHAQSELIGDGVIVRGAVTVGNLVKSYNVLYGPALIRAYDLEREYARSPRIILDPHLFDMIRQNPLLRAHDFESEALELNQLLKRDDSGLQFIDYLGAIESELDDPEDYPDLLFSHKELIEKGLEDHQSNLGVLSKFFWLRHYHNTVVKDRLTGPIQDRTLIPE
jgi:hypothetical protein